MKLLLDEMYTAAIAAQLRAHGHDVTSVHDHDYRALEGAPDEDVFAMAAKERRALVTENVADFRRLEDEAFAGNLDRPVLIYTSNRQFPRGDPATVGRLVLALHRLLEEQPALSSAIFLKPIPT